MNSIKYPSMRSNLVYTLKDLSDRELQEKEWISKKVNFTFWSTLHLLIEIIFEDLMLEQYGTENQIGVSIRNQKEADIVKPVVTILSHIIDEIGQFQPDEAYYTSSLWDELVEASRKAYELLSTNDEEAELNKK